MVLYNEDRKLTLCCSPHPSVRTTNDFISASENLPHPTSVHHYSMTLYVTYVHRLMGRPLDGVLSPVNINELGMEKCARVNKSVNQ